MSQLVFFLQNVSDAAVKIATSSTLAFKASLNPLSLGVNAVYLVFLFLLILTLQQLFLFRSLKQVSLN